MEERVERIFSAYSFIFLIVNLTRKAMKRITKAALNIL